MEDLAGVKQRFLAVRDLLDERARRLVVAAESVALGRWHFCRIEGNRDVSTCHP
jgi:hypothetical protein